MLIDTTYINYSKTGLFVKKGKPYKYRLLSYDKERDTLIFDNINKCL